MTESKSQERFEAAVELKFLNQEQLDAIRLEQQASNDPPLEIAIRKGFLNRKQLELLDILADPLSVVPGYRIEGFLGQGGVGTVYKAMQLRMDRPVAIKTINRASARNDLTPKRFEREAKIVGRLRHPNIISAFDFGIHKDQLYLVMEFVDGVDAEKLLAEEICLPELHVWYVAQQVCHALDNAKQHDVIHRDIKPGNLIFTAAPGGTKLPAEVPFVKVADFGLAKFNSKQLDATITLDQAVSGTPFYMSAEQIKAEAIDHRSDIYSLGMTIWHLITGAPPVEGAGPLDVITRKMKLEDEWLEKAPDDISNVGFQLLKKMCRHDREQRISDYGDLNQEIESVIKRLAPESFSQAGDASQSGDFELADLPFAVPARVTTIHELARTFIDVGDQNEDGATKDFVSKDIETETADFSGQPQHEHLASGVSSHGLPFYHWLAMAIGAIVLPFAIFWMLPAGKTPDSDITDPPSLAAAGDQNVNSFVRLTEFSGLPIILFNGRNIDPTQKFTGTWEPAEDPVEGGAILSGNGTRNFRCRDTAQKPLQHFRFVCGFRHNAAETIGFRLLEESETEEAQSTLWEVNIEPEEATLGAGSTSSSCPVQQFDEKTNFGYHEFRIEAQPDHWRIEVDDALLGEIPRPNKDSAGEHTVQLFVTGAGPAHFEQISFRSFSGN